MVRLVKKQADLKGIVFGEDWAFEGWPDPPQEDDVEKWEKADAKARETFAELLAYADKEAAKNATAKSNRGQEEKAAK